MSLRALVVGLGKVGFGYDASPSPPTQILSHSRALAAHQAFDLCGGVDPSATARAAFSRQYKIPAFESVAHAADTVKADVVVVATPTECHSQICVEALARVRPLGMLCEKPLAYDLIEAEKILEKCDAQGCSLYVNYVRRSDPGAIEIRKRIMDRKIALPIRAVGWYTKGLLHSGSHLLNLLEFWLGPVTNSALISHGPMRGFDAEPDVQFEFGSSTATLLAACDAHFSYHTLELVAANGRLRYDSGGRRIVWQNTTIDPITGRQALAEDEELIPNDLSRIQLHVADDWAKSLAGGQSTICSGRSALETLASLVNVRDNLCKQQ